MSSLNYFAFSENMNYIFTNKGVTKLSLKENDLNGRNSVPYTYDNLNIAVDILKENIEFRFKTGKISLLEYTSQPRKFLYQILEIFKPKDSIMIMTTKTATDAGNWMKDQKKQIQDKGLTNWAKDKATNVWNSIKSNITKAWNCLSNNFFECLMEGMRKLVFTAAGTAAVTGLSMMPGIGQVSNSIIFGSLLIWDIYKMNSSKYQSGQYKFNIMDIVIDAISLLLPVFGKVVKAAGVGIKTVGDLAKAASRGGVLGKAALVIKNGLSKIIGFIGKAAKWLGEKLGLKSLANWGNRASNQMTKISTEISSGVKVSKLGQALAGRKKELSKILKVMPKTMPTREKLLTAMGKSFAFAVTMCAALGIDGFKCRAQIHDKRNDANKGFTEEQLKKMDSILKDVEMTSL